VIVNIEKADEIPDFANHLGDLDDIFFKSSVKRYFRTHEERQYFREMSLGRYIVKHRDSFLSRLMASSVQSDISQVAWKIRRNSIISKTSRISVTLRIFAKIILHIFILILWSNIEVVEWGLLLLSDLSIGGRFIRCRESKL